MGHESKVKPTQNVQSTTESINNQSSRWWSQPRPEVPVKKDAYGFTDMKREGSLSRVSQTVSSIFSSQERSSSSRDRSSNMNRKEEQTRKWSIFSSNKSESNPPKFTQSRNVSESHNDYADDLFAARNRFLFGTEPISDRKTSTSKDKTSSNIKGAAASDDEIDFSSAKVTGIKNDLLTTSNQKKLADKRTKALMKKENSSQSKNPTWMQILGFEKSDL